MRKGNKVNITENAYYAGQDMKWTEPKTNEYILKAGTKLYHRSDLKINEFLEKTTCFSIEESSEGHIYVAILKKDIFVEEFGEDEEVRFEINNDNVEMIYVGTKVRVRTEDHFVNRHGGYDLVYKTIDRTIKI
jgi:hypothetical protein